MRMSIYTRFDGFIEYVVLMVDIDKHRPKDRFDSAKS